MNMKKFLPVLMFVTAPVIGVDAQNQSGLDLSNLDRTVKPVDDFYQFATGGWQKSHPLPAAYSRYGSFDMLQENVNKQVNSILTTLTKKKYKEGTTERKLSDFYKLALDSARRDREGIAPVKPLLNEIEAAGNMKSLHELQLKYADFGYGVPFSMYFAADEKNVTMNILTLSQGGLTLGQKDWYVNNDKATEAIREAYQKHIVRMFRLYGFTESQAEAREKAVFRFETMLALVSKSNTELRDPQANYNKMTLKQFEENYPHIPLVALTEAQGIKPNCIQDIDICQPAFFTGYDRLLSMLTVDELKAVMEWDVIMNSASCLTSEIREANFDFFGKTMSGRKVDYPLWKRATSQVEKAMGEALGKMYCERFFPASSKKMMEELVHNLQVSLGQRIDAQTWMSDSTKANAHKKLDKFYVKIGYPDKWTDYSKLTIDPSKSFYENVLNTRRFALQKMIADKAGKPVDRDEWYMTPQTVNAYYNPTTNEICFPAGILQAPFFDPAADDAANYGAIGVVIGHEMTHGFDDQGSQFDKDGNLRNWWTPQDKANFKARTQRMIRFFDGIEVLPGLHCNGALTCGENIADHGGLKVAYQAFRNATSSRPLADFGGFTPDQRFFISYGQIWANNIRPEALRNQVKTDPHAPARWRVNGALPQIEAWYKAFGIKKGDKLFVPKNKRVDIW